MRSGAKKSGGRPLYLPAVLLLTASCAFSAAQPIDAGRSTMTVRVYKAGLLSAFGHDHEISAPIAEGSIDLEAKKVELRVNAASLRVHDPKASEKDRAEVQANMLGAEVLDVQKYKEIRFHSTHVESAGAGAWKITGELSLHGVTKPVSMEVRDEQGSYAGKCRIKITNFMIKPIKVAGGTVRVKDEVDVEFEIRLSH